MKKGQNGANKNQLSFRHLEIENHGKIDRNIENMVKIMKILIFSNENQKREN